MSQQHSSCGARTYRGFGDRSSKSPLPSGMARRRPSAHATSCRLPRPRKKGPDQLSLRIHLSQHKSPFLWTAEETAIAIAAPKSSGLIGGSRRGCFAGLQRFKLSRVLCTFSNISIVIDRHLPPRVRAMKCLFCTNHLLIHDPFKQESFYGYHTQKDKQEKQTGRLDQTTC
jgi:hypothetical protein